MANIHWEETPEGAAQPRTAFEWPREWTEFSQILRLLRSQILPILSITVIVTLLSVALWSLLPVKYSASALVIVNSRASKPTVGDELVPGIGSDSATIASIIEVATSDAVLLELVRGQKLTELGEFAGQAGAKASEPEVVGALRKNLKVTRRGLTYLIEITMTAKEAPTASRIANAVAADIVKRQNTDRIEAWSGVSGALGARLSDLRDAAVASERAVSNYRESHGLIEITPESSVGQLRRSSLTQQAMALRGRLEEARALYDELGKLSPRDVFTSTKLKSDLLTGLRSQYAQEKRRSAELDLIYGPRHPQVEASQQRIAVFEQQIRAETQRLVEQARSEVDTLAQQNKAIEADLAKRSKEQLSLDQEEVALRDLVRRAEADRQLYELFLARQKATHEQANLTMPEIEVVSAAETPTRSNRPSLMVVTPVGAFTGFMLGIGFVLIRRREVVSRAQAALELGAASTAVAAAEPPTRAPLVKPSPAAADRPLAAHFAAAPDAGSGSGLNASSIFAELGCVVIADVPRLKPSPAKPNGRTVTPVALDVVDARAALAPFAKTFFPFVLSSPGQALLVTSVPGALGRTTMALAIGRLAVAMGFSALVVTDHGEAGEVRPSIRDVLAGHHDLAAAPPPETVDHVSVMSFDWASGHGFWDFANDRRAPNLLGRLTRSWDLVIFDAPPPTAKMLASAPAPVSLFPWVLLVADRDRSAMADVASSVRTWSTDEAGLVLVGLNAPFEA